MQNTEVITEKNYHITKLWVFKAPLICFLITVIALFFGYYFPYLVIAIPFYLIANPLIRKSFHYSFEKEFFFIKQGVISKKQRNLPYNVIQNVRVKQDLFDRIFGLATLSVENSSLGGGQSKLKPKKTFHWGFHSRTQAETVGSSDNQVTIPGLKKADAETLKLLFLRKMKENPLEDGQSGL